MPKTKSRGQAPARRGGREEFAGGGLVANFAEHALENPAMSGGLVVMALTAAAIVSNAMFLQGVRHPDPIFSTRPPAASSPAASRVVVPIPRSRADHVGSIAPVPRILPPAAPVSSATDRPAVAALPPALISDLQKALIARGFYRGAVDGKSGSRTRAAIAAFEKHEGLAVTGQPTAELLQRVRAPVAPAARTIAPKPPLPVAAVKPPAAPAATPIEVAPEADRFRRVQAALNRIGYGPVKVDGESDEDTANAIRRFELDNGLPLSGTVNQRLVARLVKIGAMPAI